MLTEESAKKRRLAHEGIFVHVFARNCDVRRITRPEADAFLDKYHSIGSTGGRYRYGLFIARKDKSGLPEGTLVAVATFSSARKWAKGDREIRSCEWIRYASLPDVRAIGGMGKMLQAFIDEVHPDDVMSYADTEWTDGDVYRRLGFREESRKKIEGRSDCIKFRLKLTDYA